jgi:hypothetical protein
MIALQEVGLALIFHQPDFYDGARESLLEPDTSVRLGFLQIKTLSLRNTFHARLAAMRATLPA